jgi:hypothetical protein
VDLLVETRAGPKGRETLLRDMVARELRRRDSVGLVEVDYWR